MRTARALGYRTVALCSDADRGARHVELADETIIIGPAAAAASYLAIDKILAAAKQSGADAVHPGYGFLSENAAFAQAVIDAGMVWIGPPPSAILSMGDKAASKRLMIEAGVPCIPGYQGEVQDDATLLAEAERIGRPLMVKASAGGGGKGMRLVRDGEPVAEAIAAARSEARSSFGSDLLILERAVENARHVEIQIFADAAGRTIHLGERDCSVQRRHQKVIEEAPSPAVDPALRERMGAAAVAAAQAVDYVGAGTVEFLLAGDGQFYFLEMNTRLQVEHPVTESVTGLDLVEWQFRVAAGEPLPLTQAEVRLDGAAIEVRLYAEAPAAGFLPRTGRITKLLLPEGDGIRVDHGLREGMEIGAWYDPMLAKLIATGTTRADARRRLVGALRHLFVAGCETNRIFLIDCLESPAFVAGQATTAFIGERFGEAGPILPEVPAALIALAALLTGGEPGRSSTGIRQRRLKLRCGEQDSVVELAIGPHGIIATIGGGTGAQIEIVARNDSQIRFRHAGVEQSCHHGWDGPVLWLSSDGGDYCFEDATFAIAAADGAAQGSMARAPMAGMITAILAADGDIVTKGQPMIVLEAMKMEHRITAPRDGTIERILVSTGDQVATRALLVELADVG